MTEAESLATVHTIHLPRQYAKNARANLDEINKRGGSYIINKDNRHYY